MDITIVTTAQTDEEALIFELMGMPFAEESDLWRRNHG